MSADRFEIELREFLRVEAATAPVQMGLADLRLRAGRRSRWPWPRRRRTGLAALAASGVAIAIALAFGVSRGERALNVGATPSISSSALASSGPSIRPAASASPAALNTGGVGSIMLARVDSDRITIVSAAPRAGGERVVGYVRFAPMDPEQRVDAGGVQAVSLDGDVLVTLTSGSAETPVTTNVLVRLGSVVSLERTVPNGHGTFAPNGTLVISGSNSGTPAVWVVDAASPAGRMVRPPAGVSPAGRRPILTIDGKGIIATRGSGPGGADLEPVVLGLDGSVRPLTVNESINFVTGSERVLGPDGERFGGGCDSGGVAGGGCVLILVPAGGQNPAGINITPPGHQCCTSQIWTPDGTRVVMLTDGEIWVRNEGVVDRVATLPHALVQANPSIVGFTSGPTGSYVLLESSLGTTVLDLSDGVRTFAGTLVSIVR